MTSYLHIKISHDTSCAHRVGQVIVLSEDKAEPLRIKPGHKDVAVNFESPDIIKITYRSKMIALEKKDIRIIELGEKGIFDFCGEY